MKLTREVLEAIENCLNYLYDDEYNDYRAWREDVGNEEDGHVFQSIELAQKWLGSAMADPKNFKLCAYHKDSPAREGCSEGFDGCEIEFVKTRDEVLGWTVEGEQFCRDCRPDRPVDGYPIIKGDPDWAYGSVPFCLL